MKKKTKKIWKRHFRDDKGTWEDICPHGIGHDSGVHGCDSCCIQMTHAVEYKDDKKRETKNSK